MLKVIKTWCNALLPPLHCLLLKYHAFHLITYANTLAFIFPNTQTYLLNSSEVKIFQDPQM